MTLKHFERRLEENAAVGRVYLLPYECTLTTICRFSGTEAFDAPLGIPCLQTVGGVQRSTERNQNEDQKNDQMIRYKKARSKMQIIRQ